MLLPTVCILIATYNGKEFLHEQIESCLRQKGVDVQIFVRDDGSTDGTQDILYAYAEAGLLKWYQGTHIGVQKGYLELLNKCPQCDFYAFCDQDDIWDDDKLYSAVCFLKKADVDSPAIYYSSQRLVDENGRYISTHNIADNRSNFANIVFSNIAGCTTVFNEKLKELINQCTPEYIMMHDSWAYKVCICMGGQSFVDTQPHISYRQHGKNTVGLRKGLSNYVKRIKRYLFVFNVKKQCQNILQNYRCIPEYADFLREICQYDYSLKNRFRLCCDKRIDFKSKSLNLLFKIKVLIGKM